MSRWVPLHGHSYYSLLDGIAKPAKIAHRAAKLGYSACAITDHGNIGVAVEFTTACKKHKIKPILGCEFYVCKHDPSIRPTADNGHINGRPYDHLVVLSKNLDGWRNLVRATSFSNKKEHFYYQPRMSIESFRDFTAGGNLIAISGHPGSAMANVIFTDIKAAYRAGTEEEVREYIRPDVTIHLREMARAYQSVFGKENFYLEVQIIDPNSMPACKVIASAMRWLSKDIGIPTVATADSHYVETTDAIDQRVVLCAATQTTMGEVERRLDLNQDVALGGFFRTAKYHIPSYEEMSRYHTEEEMEMAARIADECEDYSILRKPMLPNFPCPNGMSANTFLDELCRKGWREQIEGRIPDHQIDEYQQRLDMELGVIKGAGLASYFLIVQDFLNYGASQGWFMGGVRGSGAGCFVSYMIGISDIDPILYGLLFERFYNAGRNTPDYTSLPDIDADIPKFKKELLYQYLERKYGSDHVAKIATFNSMKGRGALTEVLRAWSVDYDVIKEITKIIPDPAKISEELQNVRDTFTDEEKNAGREPSIIEYCLETFADELSDWAVIRDDGSIEGEFGKYFEQAIRLEGTKRNISQHAAGVIITPEPVADLFPLVYDSSSDSYIAAMEYTKLEAAGACKFDILAVAFLDKAQGVSDLALTGRIGDDD